MKSCVLAGSLLSQSRCIDFVRPLRTDEYGHSRGRSGALDDLCRLTRVTRFKIMKDASQNVHRILCENELDTPKLACKRVPMHSIQPLAMQRLNVKARRYKRYSQQCINIDVPVKLKIRKE
jgi:hypothetical protein